MVALKMIIMPSNDILEVIDNSKILRICHLGKNRTHLNPDYDEI